MLRKRLLAMFGESRSDWEIIDLAAESSDPPIRSLGLQFELERCEPRSAVAIALDEMRDPGSPEEALTAAAFLGTHSTAEDRRLMANEFSEADGTDAWPFAVGLYRAEERWALQKWVEGAEHLVANGDASSESILKLAETFPVPDVMRIGITAARSERPAIRAKAIAILRQGESREASDSLRALADDTDELVRRAAVAEIERRSDRLEQSSGAERRDSGG